MPSPDSDYGCLGRSSSRSWSKMGTSQHTNHVLLHLLWLLILVAAGPTQTDDSQCGCYMTNGSETAYLTTHQFFDFRALSEFAGTPDIITNIDDSADANVSSPYFASDLWTNSWVIQGWNNSDGALGNSSIWMQNSPNNVYIEANPEAGDQQPQTWLTLRTQRLPDFQTAAEIESTSQGFHFASVRMLARTVGSAGACTALFTYRDQGSGPPQEADIEVLTRDPHDVIQYTNQPSVSDAGDVIPRATDNATIPHGLDWSTWAVHRYDWTAGQSTWYFDGVQVAQISFQAPRDPSHIILNAWSDGGPWSGNMTVHDAAFLQIQWLDLVFNNTEAAPKTRGTTRGVCHAVCSVDQTPSIGTPVMLWDNGARGRVNADAGLVACVSSAVVVVVVMLLSSTSCLF